MARSWLTRRLSWTHRRARNSREHKRLRTFEQLGERITPAASAFFTFETGELTIVGDAADNTIVVSSDPGGIIQVNGGGIQVLGEIPTVANTARVRISGLAGNDTLSLDEANGALPPAEISGGAGNDTLIGGSGGDILTGGSGDDQVFGNAGNDRLIWNNGDGSDLNEGGAGVDTIEITGGDVDEAFLATVVDDSILFQRVDPAPFSIVIGTSENLIVKLNGGDDSFAADGNLPGLFVDGGAGNDTIFGGAGNDRLVGGDENDFIDGNQGDDAVFLGAGDDTFRWDFGDGSDTVEGQAGIDTMNFNGSNADENIDISANGPRVRVADDVGAVVVDIDGVEQLSVSPLNGADNIIVNDLAGTALAHVKARLNNNDDRPDNLTINGTNGADAIIVDGDFANGVTISGLATQVELFGAIGLADGLTVNALGGADTVDASTLQAGAIDLVINGGAGIDQIVGSQGNDLVNGGAGNDIVVLGPGDDTFVWNPGDGSDTVEGQGGSDKMIFNGADVAENIVISANAGRVRFLREPGNIVMDLNGVEAVDFNAFGGADSITVNDLSATDLSAVNVDLNSTEGAGDGQADVVIINGTEGDDVFQIASFGSQSDVVVGGQFPFVTITGTDGPNDRLTVNALGGNDGVDAGSLAANSIGLTLNGGAGIDELLAGGGNDVVNGGPGNDIVFLEAGDDTFVWNPGDGSDTVDGMTGGDKLVFNGSDASEQFEVSANGARTELTRDIGNIVMDLNGIEVIDLNAFGGADNITVNDLSATGLTALNLGLDSASGAGTGDNSRDSVIVNGTAGNDAIQIASFGTRIAIGGLFTFVNITGEDGLDTLTLNTLGGDDAVDAANLFATNASQLIKLTVNGGAGNDTITGSQGFDTFVWNPGDGNDTIEGGNGEDTVIFNGSDVAERFDLSASGNRARFTRDIDGVTVDFGSVETLTVNPLGGADTVTVNDLTGTALTRIDLNLAAAVGDTAGDGHADSVVVNGSDDADLIPVQGIGAGILVNGDFVSPNGLPYFMIIRNVEPTDTLRINGGGGDDTIDAVTLETAVIFTADGGAGNDVLRGSSNVDLLIGGDGDDFIDGNAGADVALLGAGQDTFQWDPGDGSDVVEGQDGSDKMIFNGSEDSENIDLAANSGRVRLLRNVGNVVVDLNGVEEIDFNAFGGNDSLIVNNGEPSSLPLTLIYNAGAGDNTLVLQEGSARIDSTAVGGTLNTTVEEGAHLTTSRLSQNGLTIAENGRVTLLPNAETSVVTDLQLGAGATLDIGTSALVLDYSGPSHVDGIRQHILTGRGGPGLGASWDGTGITSSAAAQANGAEPESRSVGYVENALLPLGAYTSFRGVTVDDTAVLIAFARTGDANLDGVVNDDDVTVLGASYKPGVANGDWALGDFDYNGFVDDDDVTLLGAFFNPSAEALVELVASSWALASEHEFGSRSAHNEGLIAQVAESITIEAEHQSEVASENRPTDRRSLALDELWAIWK